MKCILYLPCVVVAAVSAAGLYAEDALQPPCMQIVVTPVTGGAVKKNMGVEEVDKHCYAVLELLEAVHERAGADAVAAEIDKHAAEVSFIFNRDSDWTLDSCSSSALNVGQMDPCEMSMLAVCRKLKEQEPPYFGSEALEKSLAGFMWTAFHHIPGEEFADVQKPAEETRDADLVRTLCAKTTSLLMECAMAYASVMDKESADAAASRLSELETEMRDLLELMRLSWGDEAVRWVKASLKETQGAMIIDTCREHLRQMDPSCYGSKALESVISGAPEP